MVNFWATPDSPQDDATFDLRVESRQYIVGKMECIQVPSGITGGPEVGTIWTTENRVHLPFYSTSNGLTGYQFEFTLTAVPEPSSLLALVGGIAGLGGFALRRKRI